MFDYPYAFQKVNQQTTFLKEPVKKVFYRFKAKRRTYFVTFEEFSFGIVAIKYCDIKDKDSKNAYKKIFNDGDGIRVITTCLHIMREYWATNRSISFAFYAVKREYDKSVFSLPETAEEEFVKKYERVRFFIYRYAMLNLFPPEYFRQYQDVDNCLYILLNKKQKDPVISLQKLGKYLLDHYELIFNPESIEIQG